MSVRDRNGNRISVPDPNFIDEVGRLARQMAESLKLQRELGVVESHQVAVLMNTPPPPVVITPFGVSPAQRVADLGLAETADYMRQRIMATMGVPASLMRPPPEPDRLGGLPVDQAIIDELFYEPPNNEPPDDGLEYEIVARTATSRKKKAVKTKEEGPVYCWGVQSSKPRNGGHFITYEVQLHEDGTTSCNCPGWIFKKSTEDRGCKHTRSVEDEAKDFIKKHKAGESLPTVAPSEEQMMRLAKSKGNTSGDTSIKFNRVVDLD